MHHLEPTRGHRRLGRAALFAFGATLACAASVAGCGSGSDSGSGGKGGSATGGVGGSSGKGGSAGAATGGSAGTSTGGSGGTSTDAGSCSFDPGQVNCQDAPDSGLEIRCDIGSCCECIDHGTTTKVCTTSVPCGGPVSCCSASAASCCGF